MHQGVHDQFVDKLVVRAKAMKVGHALEAATQIGPAVSEQKLSENMAYVDLAAKEGAERLCGGERLKMTTDGYYMTSGVFVGTKNVMCINRGEMFALLACVIPVAGYDEALHVVNDINFGLTFGIVTINLARATQKRKNGLRYG